MSSKRVRAALGVLLIGLLQACSSNSEAQRRAEVRFRVDVTINDDGVEHLGTGVWSFSLVKPTLALVSPYNSVFRAEAIPIKLGDGEWVFVLPANDDTGFSAGQWPERFFNISRDDDTDVIREMGKLSKQIGRTAIIECFNMASGQRVDPAAVVCPSMVKTGSLSDPQSFRPVNFNTVKYKGTGTPIITGVQITITDRSVTKRLDAMLPWLLELARLLKTDKQEYFRYYRERIPSYLAFIRLPYLAEEE